MVEKEPKMTIIQSFCSVLLLVKFCRLNHMKLTSSPSAVECHLNLVVIMDSSGSVGYHDYQLELTFVKTLLEIVSLILF